MRETYDKFVAALCKAQLALSVTALLAMVSLNAVEIARRYFFSLSIVWVQEVTVLLLLWFTFMGFSYVTYAKMDIYITLFVNKLSPPVAKSVVTFVTLVILLFLCVYTYYTMTLFFTQFGQTTVVARHPISWRTLAPLINGATMILVFVKNLRECLFPIKTQAGEA